MPGTFRAPKRESQQAMFGQILGGSGHAMLLDITRGCQQAMVIGQDDARNEMRVLKASDDEPDVDPFSHEVDEALGDKDLCPHLGMGFLKGANQRREERVGDTRRRGDTQRSRYDR